MGQTAYIQSSFDSRKVLTRIAVVVLVIGLIGLGVWYWKSKANARKPRLLQTPDVYYPDAVKAYSNPPSIDERGRPVAEAVNLMFRHAQAGRVDQCMESFDLSTMADEVIAAAGTAKIPNAQRKQAIKQLEANFANVVRAKGGMFGARTFEVCRVIFAENGDAGAFVRIYIGDGIEAKHLIWLAETDGRWRIYDLERLDDGLGSVRTAAKVQKAAGTRNILPAWAVQAQAMVELTLVQDNPEFTAGYKRS